MHHWIKLRLGIADHLAIMSDAEIKLFVFLTTQAPIAGPEAGAVRTTIRIVAERCGWSKTKAARVLADLSQHGYVSVQHAANQQDMTSVVIHKFVRQDQPNEARQSPASGTAESRQRDSRVPPTGQQSPAHGTAESRPRDSRVPPAGQHGPQAIENTTTSDTLRVREREEREEYSPLPPSRPHWSDEDFPELPDDALEYLMDVYPIGRHSPTTARAAFQAECVDNPNFAKIYPKLRAAVEYAAHRCPPAKRQFLPGLARVIKGDWEGLQARTDHYAAEVATGAPAKPTIDQLREQLAKVAR